MSRLLLPVLLAAAAGLAALVAAELASGPAAAIGEIQEAVAAAASPAAPALDPVPAEVAALLGRPLFAPDRKPDPAAAGADPRLPHLTGIMVNSQDKRAIFAAADGARAAVLGQGDTIGAYRVDAITPAEVTLTGPDGPHTVRPTFSATPAAAALGAAPPLNLPSPAPVPMPPFPATLQPAPAGLGRAP